MPGLSVSKAASRESLKSFLLRQREQLFPRSVSEPEIERRATTGRQRALTDRRSSIEPNRTMHSRRVSVVDRRRNRFGRRKDDLLGHC